MNKRQVKTTHLPLPQFYNSINAFNPEYRANEMDLHRTAIEWKSKYGLTHVDSDLIRICLLIIDAQFSFCFPSGSLYVGGRSGRGAMDDNARLSEFIYRNLRVITEVKCSLDTHNPFQIFFPIAHLCEDGSHPLPGTIISADDYKRGKYQPNPAMAYQLRVGISWLKKQFIYYCEELEKSGKYQLIIWPYHVLLGSIGHTLAGVIDEARLFHSFVRGASNIPLLKGENPLTEHYSVFKPEVMTLFDGKPMLNVQKDTKLMEALLRMDMLIIAGQAKSHCVAWTINDLLCEIMTINPALAKKVYLLDDCSSSVVLPGGPDFTDEANAAFEKFRNVGMNIVRSTEPIEDWPNIDGFYKLLF